MIPRRDKVLGYRHSMLLLIILVFLILAYPGLAYAQQLMIPRLPTNDKVVALTFDDKPLPGTTERLVNILEEESVTATFFLQGNGIVQYPAQARYIRDNGFPICNHTYSHPVLPKLSDDRVVGEVNAMRKSALDILGVDTTPFFRPPYGSCSGRVVADLNSVGYTDIIGWTIDTLDWRGSTSPASIIQAVEGGLRPGAIVLMHVSCDNTVQALPTIIKYIKAQGYKFTDIPTFYGRPQPQQNLHKQASSSETSQTPEPAKSLDVEETSTDLTDGGFSPTEELMQETIIIQAIRSKTPDGKLPLNFHTLELLPR